MTPGDQNQGASDSGTGPDRVLVTGGAGFIGSNLVRQLVSRGVTVINLDSLTYAGHLASLTDLQGDPRHRFVMADLRDTEAVREVLQTHRPQAVIHLAAESHVDRSIVSPAVFVETNVVGTFNLLQQSLRYFEALPDDGRDSFRLLAVSTDEVYGFLGPDDPPFDERTRYDPSSPYAASKAGADHLVRAFFRTYGLPVIVSNCCNNYGPCQLPEKLLPRTITRAVAGQPLPVYGRGENLREWLFVGDHCEALWRVLTAGRPGQTYHIGSGEQRRNIDLVHAVCDLLDQVLPPSGNPRLDVGHYRELVTFVADRPGHDFRYAIDASRIRDELGWQPRENLHSGLARTVRWYLDHPHWVEQVVGDQGA